MDLKENLKEIRNYINNRQFLKSFESLDTKVEKFIKWYDENLLKGHYTDIGIFHQKKEIRNFIEKMAVWYELRIPDAVVGKMLSSQNNLKTSEIFSGQDDEFQGIINSLNEAEKCNIAFVLNNLKWSSFLSLDTFINTLDMNEKKYIENQKYYNILVYINEEACFRINSVGKILMAINMDKSFEGMNVHDAYELLKSKNLLSQDSHLEQVIRNYDNRILMRNGVLDCVMYRIIERGGKCIGPRRGLIFAQEFDRDINVPMIYGINITDCELKTLINEYLKKGGITDLQCYEDYDIRASDREKLNIITISKLIEYFNLNGIYTDEERVLQKRLVKALYYHGNKALL